MKIVVEAKVDLDPARRAEALAGAKPWIDGALSQDGCLAYSWCADPYDPARVNVFEEWETEADLAHHLSAEPYLQMSGHLNSVGIKAASTRKYRVDLIEPVYDPEGKPRADFFTAK